MVEVSPFKDLPGALVEDMLSECSILGSTLLDSFKKIYDNKASIHGKLVKKGIIKKDSEVFIALYNPTSCGIDGSYVNDRLLSTDMLAMAAVAIEGLTPPSEKRHWPIPQSLYEELLDLLKSQGIDVKIGYGTGPSRKMSLITMAFKKLEISNYIFHNVKRGYYFFPNVSNLNKVIHHGEEPDWYDRPFKDLSAFWKKRWCIPRSKRTEKWKNFDSDNFFQTVKSDLDNLH